MAPSMSSAVSATSVPSPDVTATSVANAAMPTVAAAMKPYSDRAKKGPAVTAISIIIWIVIIAPAVIIPRVICARHRRGD
jgi:hypothetical protein